MDSSYNRRSIVQIFPLSVRIPCISIRNFSNKLCIGATFEMRTALCEMHISIDNMIMHDRVYIWNQKLWGESRIVERQKERECERQCIAENERWRGQ